MKITAPTWAEINLDNIKFNLKNIKSLLSEDTKICGVVKANAYGHGAVEVSKLLQLEKIDYLAVARLEEGIELIENDITLPILCLGYIPKESLEIAIKDNIEITVYSLDVAKTINKIAARLGKVANIHIKIDTGMTRIGFIPNESSINEIISINSLQNIHIRGMYTHFATADEVNKEFTYEQVSKFKFVENSLCEKGVQIPIKHISNSAGTMDCEGLEFDMVRCGIILYGHYPSDDVDKNKMKLKPAMTLKTRVSHLKEISLNTGISYGLTYVTKDIERIATIPIGYADGFTRIQKNPKVIIKGEVFDVVGRICMDQCMVKINKDININIGDEVIIFGEEIITVENIAKDLETINYEVLCMISRRVDHVYMERNAIVQVDSYLIK
ncbi:MAG: alanine racemase [Romboutsia sp.]